MTAEIRGTPAYLAANSSAAVIQRRDRGFLSITGAAPGDMLKGILSGKIPPPLTGEVDGALVGGAPYSTILTPKGKMVTDLSVLPDPSGGFLLDLPGVGREAALAHFRKYLHPRFAQVEDRTALWSQFTLVGPRARAILENVLDVEGPFPEPDHLRYITTPQFSGIWIVGNGDLGLPAFDLVIPGSEGEVLQAVLENAGVRTLDEATLEVLRIEEGTPRFGVDMTEDTIPIEAGIHNRAIDYQKGCYTGQEVIVRIRDRGQVNKSLRRLFLGRVFLDRTSLDRLVLGEAELPEMGDQLFAAAGGKAVGWITSVCLSPRYNEVIALGVVKRLVNVGEEVRVGGPEGPLGLVGELKGDR